MPTEPAAAPVRFPANPTKEFFVEMLTRDVKLIPAIEDLIDNSVDGALRGGNGSLEGFWIRISATPDQFIIEDNCGGIPYDIAERYAFRIGRPPSVGTKKGSLGRFGVGMKRSLFKLGHKFEVKTRTPTVSYEVSQDLNLWMEDLGPDWSFPCTNKVVHDPPLPLAECGTTIRSTELREDVAAKVATAEFWDQLTNKLSKTYRQVIQRGFRISVKSPDRPEKTISAEPLQLISDEKIKPGTRTITFRPPGAESDVTISAIAGVIPGGDLSDTGWYVFCNDRLIVEAARGPDYGYGRQFSFPAVPHGQYSRFQGFVWIDSEDTSLLPWTTAKDDIDTATAVFRKARAEVMLPLADEVRELLDDVKEEQEAVEEQEARKLARSIERGTMQSVSKGDAVHNRPLARPALELDRDARPDLVSIQYKKPRSLVKRAQEKLKASSAGQVGEKTFDLYIERAGLDNE